MATFVSKVIAVHKVGSVPVSLMQSSLVEAPLIWVSERA